MQKTQKDNKTKRHKGREAKRQIWKNAKKSIGIGCVSCSHRRMQLVAACCGKTFSCLRNNFISPGTYLAAIIWQRHKSIQLLTDLPISPIPTQTSRLSIISSSKSITRCSPPSCLTPSPWFPTSLQCRWTRDQSVLFHHTPTNYKVDENKNCLCVVLKMMP